MPLSEQKANFIKMMWESGKLKIESREKGILAKQLKSGRMSPHFVDLRQSIDGDFLLAVGEAYGAAVRENVGEDFDVIFGPSYAGIPLTLEAVADFRRRGVNRRCLYDRKEEKSYGEATGVSHSEKAKKMLVGELKDGDRVVLVDDVITTGETKNEALETLNACARGLKFPGLFLAVDRQEVGTDADKSAAQLFAEKTGVPVHAIVTTREILGYLRENHLTPEEDLRRVDLYLRAYGTKESRGNEREKRLVSLDRGLIPACDIETIEEFEALVDAVDDIEGVAGYKIGFDMALGYGLPRLVEVAKRRNPNRLVIYDHQKAATDIPEMGKNFARRCKKSGVDAVILFPQAGPETERAWIYHALEQELGVLVGGEMTHAAYKKSEGGFIDDAALERMYGIAADAGVTHFVVPGNRVPRIEHYLRLLKEHGIETPYLFSPGFVAQGGKITDAAKVVGNIFYPIVGRGIVLAEDKRAAAQQYAQALLAA